MPDRRRVVVAVSATLLALAAGLVAPTAARADDDCTVTWKSGVGAWSDATRWTPARVPTATDTACVLGTSDRPATAVVSGGAEAATLVVRGATLRTGADARIGVGALRTSDAALTGDGDLGARGATIRDTRLAGPGVRLSGTLDLGGRLLVSGGAGLDLGTPASPQVSFTLAPGTRVLDGDGDPGNHLGLYGGVGYLSSVFVGVRLVLGDVDLFAQSGQVRLTRLANLEVDGDLLSRFGSGRTGLGAFGDGELVLPVGVRRIGAGVDVDLSGNGRVTTDFGADAFSGLRAVNGTLRTGQRLTVGDLTVAGTLSTTAPVSAPSVTVTGSFGGPEVTGSLTCTGRCDLRGTRVGALTLGADARVTVDAGAPLTARAGATLAGTLVVTSPPAPGTSAVLLTAAGGVRGSFAAVTTDVPGRTVTPTYRGTFVSGRAGRTAGA